MLPRFLLPFFQASFFCSMHLNYFIHWLSLLISCTLAAEYIIPSTWNGTKITASWEERQSVIAAAIQEEFTNGTSHCNVCEFIWDLLITGRNLGIHAIRAYNVYQDIAMLELAAEVWQFGRSYTISPTDVSASSIATKSFSITKTCSGATLAGGMFWVRSCVGIELAKTYDMFFTSVMLKATVPSMLIYTARLSAYLSQATGDAAYLSAAQDSGAFMIDVIDVTGEGNGLAAISADDSATCSDIWSPGNYQIDQAGLFMEGLAVLPGNTTFGLQNLSVDSMRSSIVNITLSTNPLCNAPNGIINTGGGEGAPYLVQGLGALYHVTQEPVDLIMYMGSFLGIQYNTIITAATTPGSNIYASSWIGPPAPFNSYNQTMAIFGLVNGAQVLFATPNNGSTNSSTSIDAQHKSITGPVVGGTFGGLILLAVTGFLINRRIRQSTAAQEFVVDPLDVSQLYSSLPPLPNNTTNITEQPPPEISTQGAGAGPSRSTDLPSMAAIDSVTQLEAYDELAPAWDAGMQENSARHYKGLPNYQVGARAHFVRSRSTHAEIIERPRNQGGGDKSVRWAPEKEERENDIR
ncbi:hypothetical protein BDP27DRAFT_1373374 [Rhodocollybia butyracea]|uniref:Glycoside hydrolase family 76 protein n=1 Tax=Rhodocollybia butyracea TaxID=206335 RepID=A0A9P5TY24_9AGAR|nr:hypothetical protein BDP27DRAFT_1373374 [Rhodocollybia butyracea]